MGQMLYQFQGNQRDYFSNDTFRGRSLVSSAVYYEVTPPDTFPLRHIFGGVTSEAYMTYRAYATGEKTPKPKTTKKKAGSDDSQTQELLKLRKEKESSLRLRKIKMPRRSNPQRHLWTKVSRCLPNELVLVIYQGFPMYQHMDLMTNKNSWKSSKEDDEDEVNVSEKDDDNDNNDDDDDADNQDDENPKWRKYD
ncbi:hypothetical protein Tco_0132939 [Tanacetum coccineum]